ncbi:unnamed protein product [Hyaloperonospora brassicae]|uniref:Uncharacterized protein n=1 Tax=Hyaloperonospora brassicae TaxID=162125 RepID=A0AAV0TFP8_HYABA|nr:unnamed protein product [Hyaloperonospora brassicae]
MSGGQEASCRLGRWLSSFNYGYGVRAVGLSISGPFSDHNGVAIRVAVPIRSVQVKTRRQVYSPANNAERTSEAVTTDFFAGASAHLEDVITAASIAVDKARAAAGW